MEFGLGFRRVDRRWLFAVVLVAVTHLLLQSSLLPYGNALRSLLSENEPAKSIGYDTRSSTTIRNTLAVNASDPFEEDSDEKSFNVDEGLDGDITEIGLASQENGLLDDGFSSESVDIIRKAGDNQIPEPNVSLSLRRSDDGSLETRLQLSETSKPSENMSLASQTTNSSITIVLGPKKMRCDMPPKTVTTFQEMNKILVRHRAKSRAPRPLWSSPRDQEILAARAAIERAPVARDEKELYAPIFRNVSTFKKSYEMMERTLKVYVYKEGEKPIFHQPILKGLYASEGWFMKLMEGNKKFSVRDPRRAHLFYMPFSSRMLEFSLYVRNSHNRTNLRDYLRLYSEKIASKYRHWNRTRGADHFLVACHDWAPYETRHHMEQCIKAMCNTDVTGGFKIGRDVSLPETYVRSVRNPLRDLGGRPASQRPILAFYAGNLHGYLRPILLRRWKDDPDMKILGPMPPGVATKTRYIEYMKTSRYCVCPKGYEVNSPRIVEAIFYECVPVILSDNFVPPFFEVLDWEAFSVVVAEKDVPKLKDILVAIPDERYEAMQRAVRRAQRHFLWHAKPVKYDLFHMVLHSIWYNRVFQLKPR